MFDTMTLTKAGGALCGSLLLYLLGAWAAETIYHQDAGHGAEGEEHAAAYVIETGGAAETGAAEEGPDFATLMASADAGKGERVFAKCKACHKIDGSNGTGPHLDGVVNRAVDEVDGFAYSGALEAVADTWTPENLFHFIENPKGFAPGTKMGFAGIKSPEDRADLIAYLQTLGG